MFTLAVFEILMVFEGRSVLSPAKWGTGSGTVKLIFLVEYSIKQFIIIIIIIIIIKMISLITFLIDFDISCQIFYIKNC